MLRPDPHVTVVHLHMRLRDDRFPGWSFEIIRTGSAFFARASKAMTICTTHGYLLAADALDGVRKQVRASQANRLGVDLESL